MNALVPATVDWQPKEQKMLSRGVAAAALIAAATGGAFAIKAVVPTWIDALNLVQQLFSSGIYMLGTGAVLLTVGYLAYDTFVPGGGINKVVAQWYSSMINQATWALLDIDPLTPLHDQKRDMVARKEVFDDAFADFDGTIENLRQQEAKYRADADVAKRRAKAAHGKIADDSTMSVTFETLSYEAGRLTEAADGFASMRTRLEPVRNTIFKLREAVATILQNLDVDIRVARDTWAAQKSVEKMNKSARGVLNQKYELAQEAMNIINTKYAVQIGRLENLKDITKPLLDSISLDKGTYSEALLAEWETESAEILRLPAPSQAPMTILGMGQPQAVPAGRLSGLM